MKSKQIKNRIMKHEARLEKSQADLKEAQATLQEVEEKIKKAVLRATGGTERAKKKLNDLKRQRTILKDEIEDHLVFCGESLSTIRRLESDLAHAIFSENKSKVTDYVMEALGKVKKFKETEGQLFDTLDEILPPAEISNIAHSIGIRNIYHQVGRFVTESHRWQLRQRFGVVAGDVPSPIFRRDIQTQMNEYFESVLKTAQPEAQEVEKEKVVA